MKIKTMRIVIGVAALAACLLAYCGLASAQDPGLAGWEKGGAYDSRFDPKESDSFKGTIEDIVEIRPMPGMAPGVGLIMRDKKDGKPEKVQLGPISFVNLEAAGIRKGEQIKVVGVWANIGGEEVIMAAKLKKSEDQELKLRRSRDGFPFWAMSPEERQKELSGQ